MQECDEGRMMFNPNKPCMTRDGREAYVTSTKQEKIIGGYEYPIRAKVKHPNIPGEWVEWAYLPDGRWKSNESENNNDLVNQNLI
jgi:hypothetical protein